MKITKVKIVRIENSKRLRATCYVVIDNTIVIDNIRLFEKDNGKFFVEFPRSRSSEKKNYEDITIIKRDFRNHIEGVILKEYEKKIKENENGKADNTGKDIKVG